MTVEKIESNVPPRNDVDAETTEKKEWSTLSEEEKKKMRESAQEIPIAYRTSFKDAIGLLLSAEEEGKNCFITFNEDRYYSVDINTMDDAYLQREWMTEAEWDAYELELDRAIAKKEQKSELKTAEEILERLNTVSRLFEESSPYIQPEKLVEWEEDLRESVDSSLVPCIIELLKMISDWNSREEIKSAFDKQDLSVWQHAVVRDRVLYYSKNWKEAKRRRLI